MSESHDTQNSPQYNLAVIRKLVQAAFNPSDLRRLCQDRPALRPILNYFGPGFDFMEMVDAVIEQCRIRALLPDLLRGIQEANPRQYERYSDQLLVMGSGQRVVNRCSLDMSHTFKDREQEIQAVREYLMDRRVRLITIVGRAGIGKTALVCHVLADLEQTRASRGKEGTRLVDGILYLNSESTGLSLERIYTDVKRMLGEPAASRLAIRWRHGDAHASARVDYLLEAMQDGVFVIFLDNLEKHLTEEGKITDADADLRVFIEHCLLQSGRVRLIVTSRQEVQLPPAVLPRVRIVSLLEGLPEDDASALLHELDPQGRLGLRDASEGDLRHISQLTQGIPRALQLVAGILDHDPTMSLHAFLQNKQLFGEKVVEELVAEGYARLENDERRVMEALAIFGRPVEKNAIAYLLVPWFPDLDVRNSLRHLVRSYFVNVNRLADEYSLHPLDREYALSRLVSDDSPQIYSYRDLELRAAAFYASIRKPESEWKAIEDLAPQLTEFEHLIRAGDYDEACQVLQTVDYGYLYRWGHYTLLVELRERLQGKLTDPTLQASNAGALGNAFSYLGDNVRAAELYEQAVDISRKIEDQHLACLWLGNLGRARRNLGEYKQAIRLHEQALAIARKIANRQLECIWLSNLGVAYHELGQLEWAVESYKLALSIAQEIGAQWEEGYVLNHLGRVYRDLGLIEHATKLHEQACTIAREVKARRLEGIALSCIGLVYHAVSQFDAAALKYQQALDIGREIGDRSMQSYALLGLGGIRLALGNASEAQLHFLEANNLDTPVTRYQLALASGVALLHLHEAAALDAFTHAIAYCRTILNKTADLYEPRFALAAALLGPAILSPHWMDEDQRATLLVPTLEEYRRALEICTAPSVVGGALRVLEMIRAASVRGLEPVFELLEAVRVDGDVKQMVIESGTSQFEEGTEDE